MSRWNLWFNRGCSWKEDLGAIGLGRLGPIDVCLSFMSAWFTGILEALDLLRALFMMQTILLMKPSDVG